MFLTLSVSVGVLKLGSSNRINERCLELQTNKKGKNVKESKSKVLGVPFLSPVFLLKSKLIMTY